MDKVSGLFPSLALLVLAFGGKTSQGGERWTQYSPFTPIIRMADGGKDLWLATDGGVIRLEKATGEKTWFNQANSALTDSRVRALASDEAGRVWVSTQAGMLAEFDGMKWWNLSAGSPLEGAAVLDLAWDFRGSLWVLAVEDANGKPTVFRRQDGQWTRLYLEGVDPMGQGSPENGFGHGYGFGYPFLSGVFQYHLYPISPIYLQAGGDGEAWVVARSEGRAKLYHIAPSGRVDTPEMPQSLVPRWFVVPRSGSPFWLCARFLAKSTGTGWETLALPGGITGQIFAHPRNSTARTADGSLYLALTRLVKYRDSLSEAGDIPGDTPGRNPLLLEPETGSACPQGNCFRMAQGGRVGSLAGETWTWAEAGITPIDSLPIEVIHPRTAGAPEILMGTFGGLKSFHPATARVAPIELGAPWNGRRIIYGLGEDRHGRIWIKGGHELLSRVGEDGVRTFTPGNSPVKGYADYRPGAAGFMAVDARGTVWVADSGKLISIPDGSDDVRTWKTHPLPLGPGSEGVLVNSIAMHKDGSFWVAGRTLEPEAGVHNLVGRYDGKTWRMFDGSHHAWFESSAVLDLRCDGNGLVWALFKAGLLQWDGVAWKAPAAPLQKRIQTLAVDGEGRLWAATAPPEAGLWHWNGRWDAVSDSRARMATSAVRSMVFDASGKLWMATVGDGVMVFDPAGEIPTGKPAGRRPARTLPPSLARQADGSWRLTPGPLAGDAPLAIRVHNLQGTEVPGTDDRLPPSPGGGWTWPGPRLPPGIYLLSVQDRRGRKAWLPFLQGSSR